MFDLWLQARQSRGGIKHRNGLWALPKKHTSGQRVRLILSDTETTNRGVSMSRAHRTAGVHDDAVIAFLLFCLEIYQAEQKRKRTLH
jgi:hypothetical protein